MKGPPVGRCCFFGFTLFSLLCHVSAQGSNNSSNGSNDTNCTDNATEVNQANYSGPPLCEQAPELPCFKDKCWTTIPREAINSCMELTFWGAEPGRCAFFNESATQACNISCSNCGSIASAMYDECLFTLLAASTSFDDAAVVCQGLADDFENIRCPSALLDTTSDCFGREADDCQALCGNWHKCDCWKLRGVPGEADVCVGETEILRWDGTPDNCDQIPRTCFNHRPGTLCGRYRHCPANICIINSVTCPITDSCQKVGVCAPGDGQCYYSTHPDGTPCDDGLHYTHTDTCKQAVCTGIEDRCVRFSVQCQTLNSCLTPTTKVRGACDPPTGSCVFEAKADGTACSSQPGGAIDGTCDAGLCRRAVYDICAGKTCASPDFCAGPGTCDPWTGECTFVSPLPEGEACDDGDTTTFRKRCVEGRCVGDPVRTPLYWHEGSVACDGKAGIDASVRRYFGNVAQEEECQEQCSQDPWCKAYAYGYYVCYIYGGERTIDPAETYWGQRWLLVDPAAQPAISHTIHCFSKRSNAKPAPFFDETAAWFGLTVVIVVVFPALWGLAMVWRPLSRSFRNLTGCCGGLREDEWSPSKDMDSRHTSKDQVSRSVSQVSMGNYTSKVHTQEMLEDDETYDNSQDTSRTDDHGQDSQDLPVKWNKAQDPEHANRPHDPRGEVQEPKQ